jgi:catechol 2,3-dioxygenase-like lactoylglutathione lyase family enzyme
VVVIPVSDVDRAKEFYGRLGWRLDADFAFDNGVNVVQFTPPGSPDDLARAMRRARPPTASTRTHRSAGRELARRYATYMVAEQAGRELPT